MKTDNGKIPKGGLWSELDCYRSIKKIICKYHSVDFHVIVNVDKDGH